ncbi:hypothetical protein EXS71_02235 [Candidatus Uhrbacteria bacterium]|nr:hypothetical protein [Candidatus Uhrbacteria bacterium]
MIFDYIPQHVVTAVLASVATLACNVIFLTFRRSTAVPIAMFALEQRDIATKQKAVNEQIAMIISSNERYRDELKEEITDLKNDIELSQSRHQKEITSLREHYEFEIELLGRKVATLSSEVLIYRRENSALHQLLRKSDVVIPEWISIFPQEPK